MDLFLIFFAIAIIIYRFVLYIGIALLVYHFIVKIVGIALFIAEVGFFLILPIWKELKVWWTYRGEIVTSRRLLITMPAIAGLAVLFFLPMSSSIIAPAVLEPENFQRLFPAEAGQVEKILVQDGQRVARGDVLFVLSSPKLLSQKTTTEAEIAIRELRLARVASDSFDLGQRQILHKELKSLRSKLEGLDNLENKLTVKADFDGTVTDVSNRLFEGRSISRAELLGVLIGGEKTVSRGYVSGGDIARIKPNSAALFVPDDISSKSIPLVLSSIAKNGSDAIDLASLASVNGGRIAVTPERNMLVPVSSEYAVKAETDGGIGLPTGVQRGVLKIVADRTSLAESIWHQVAKVLVRELGI